MNDKIHHNVFAVVPAAGAGRRMNAAQAKQYLPLLGKTVLEHTLTRLLAEPGLASIVVVVAAGDTRWQSLPVFDNPRVSVVDGGSERSQSVLNGLRALSTTCRANDWVMVHDVARPCVAGADLKNMLNTLYSDDVGGILAVPCSDTIKQVAQGRIETTLDRSRLWQAQTPQMFRYQLLVDAIASGLERGLLLTDEASAVEAAGYDPKVVEGSAANIKITRPEDLALAEYYLQKSESVCG